MKRSVNINPFTPSVVKIGALTIDWTSPIIMGVLNVTPDSFFDGGKWNGEDTAIRHGIDLMEQGAHIIDIGGESTRPGSESVPTEEEIKRTKNVVQELVKQGAVVSIDTMKHDVAEQALKSGAHIVNDVTGGTFDETILDVVSEYNAFYIIGHIRGLPKTMQKNVSYKNFYQEIKEELQYRVDKALKKNIPLERLWIDPGIGFGKTALQSARLNGLAGSLAKDLGLPIVIGPSNKSFIGNIASANIDERLPGTIAACLVGWITGAHIFRVHNVKALSQAFLIYDACLWDFQHDEK